MTLDDYHILRRLRRDLGRGPRLAEGEHHAAEEAARMSNPLHCWHGNTDDLKVGSDEWAKAFNDPGVCMLPAGHEGPHEYTPDGEIEVEFQ